MSISAQKYEVFYAFEEQRNSFISVIDYPLALGSSIVSFIKYLEICNYLSQEDKYLVETQDGYLEISLLNKFSELKIPLVRIGTGMPNTVKYIEMAKNLSNKMMETYKLDGFIQTMRNNTTRWVFPYDIEGYTLVFEPSEFGLLYKPLRSKKEYPIVHGFSPPLEKVFILSKDSVRQECEEFDSAIRALEQSIIISPKQENKEDEGSKPTAKSLTKEQVNQLQEDYREALNKKVILEKNLSKCLEEIEEHKSVVWRLERCIKDYVFYGRVTKDLEIDPRYTEGIYRLETLTKNVIESGSYIRERELYEDNDEEDRRETYSYERPVSYQDRVFRPDQKYLEVQHNLDNYKASKKKLEELARQETNLHGNILALTKELKTIESNLP